MLKSLFQAQRHCPPGPSPFALLVASFTRSSISHGEGGGPEVGTFAGSCLCELVGCWMFASHWTLKDN